MKNDDLARWTALIRELKVTGRKASACTNESFHVREGKFGIRFPAGYGEFCEVFGSGFFGGFIRLCCPDAVDANDVTPNSDALNYLQQSLGIEALKKELIWEVEHRRQEHVGITDTKLALLERILVKAFAFGDDPNAHIYLWDLNSYREDDKSYDIYLIPTDDLETTTLIGRDFYEFVRDFCLGFKAKEVLPPEFTFYNEMTAGTFHRF